MCFVIAEAISNGFGTKGVFRYPGSKNKVAQEINQYFPKHKIFVEVFGGSAAVLLRKERSKVEIYNDIKKELVNFFQVLVYDYSKFISKAKFIINSKDWFYQLRNDKNGPEDKINAAINTYYLLKFGFNGRRSGWPLNIEQNSRPPINEKFLLKVHERLKKVQFTNQDYQKLILKTDSRNTLFYLDPPYLGVGSNLYNEFDNDEFEKFLQSIDDPWILSYPTKLSEWYHQEIKIQYSMSKRENVTEYLISNRPFVKYSKQTSLGEDFL